MKDIIKALAAIYAAVPAERIYVTKVSGLTWIDIQAESDIAARSIAEVLDVKLSDVAAVESQWIAGNVLLGEVNVTITGPHHRRVALDETALRATAELAQGAVG